MDRMKRAAQQLRDNATANRSVGREDEADRQEARATELESGHVTDRTDTVSALIRWGLGRNG